MADNSSQSIDFFATTIYYKIRRSVISSGSEYKGAMISATSKFIAASLVILILIGAYVSTRRDPTLLVQDILISAPAGGKPYPVVFINQPGINTIKVKLTHAPTKERVTMTYVRANGDRDETIVLGANRPSATTVNIKIKWI